MLVMSQGKSPFIVRFFTEVEFCSLVAMLYFDHFLMQLISDVVCNPPQIKTLNFYSEHLELAQALQASNVAVQRRCTLWQLKELLFDDRVCKTVLLQQHKCSNVVDDCKLVILHAACKFTDHADMSLHAPRQHRHMSFHLSIFPCVGSAYALSLIISVYSRKFSGFSASKVCVSSSDL